MNIKDILDLQPLKDAIVIAGKNKLDNKVNSISVLEVAEKKIKNWVLKDQVFITAFYAIMNDVSKQKEVIKILHENGCSGLIICHLNLFVKEIDKEIIELCDDLSFPLIIANSNRSYIDILNPIILKIMGNEKSSIGDYNKESVMYNKLIESIVSRNDLATIYKTMAFEYGKKIFFLDINNKLIYGSDDYNCKEHIQEFELACEKVSDKDQYFLECEDMNIVVFPVRYSGIEYGKIVAETSREFSEDDISLLKNFSRIFILIATKSSRISELEVIKKQEYISDLITWNFRTDEIAIRMGKEVNWNIVNKEILILINLNDVQKDLNIPKTIFEKFMNDILYEQIRTIVKSDNEFNLVGLRSDIFIILLDGKKNIRERSRNICRGILKICSRTFKVSVSIGISSCFENPKDIPDAYMEAKEAVIMGRKFFGENEIIFYEELGYYGLIRQIKNLKNYKVLHDNLFKKLKKIDEEKNSSLYRTLEVLILNGLNTDRVARKMFVHRNTVNYRKREIEKILGYKPWEMPYLLNTIMEIVTETID